MAVQDFDPPPSTALATPRSGAERRLSSWLGRMPQVLAQYELGDSARLGLVHVLPTRGETVAQWPIRLSAIHEELAALTRDVFQAAHQDAQSFTTPQQYAVCLYASNDLDAEPLIRHVFRITRGDGAAVGSSLLGEGSEPANAQGLLAQTMRHMEAMQRGTLLKDGQMLQLVDRMFERNQSMSDAMHQKLSGVLELVMEQLDRSESRRSELEERHFGNMSRWEEASGRSHERAMEQEDRAYQRRREEDDVERAREDEQRHAERRHKSIAQVLDSAMLVVAAVAAEKTGTPFLEIASRMQTQFSGMFQTMLEQAKAEAAKEEGTPPSATPDATGSASGRPDPDGVAELLLNDTHGPEEAREHVAMFFHALPLEKFKRTALVAMAPIQPAQWEELRAVVGESAAGRLRAAFMCATNPEFLAAVNAEHEGDEPEYTAEAARDSLLVAITDLPLEAAREVAGRMKGLLGPAELLGLTQCLKAKESRALMRGFEELMKPVASPKSEATPPASE